MAPQGLTWDLLHCARRCTAPSLWSLPPEMARHRLRCIPFIGVPRAAIRDRPPQRAQQGAQHLPHTAQLADFMRYQVQAVIKRPSPPSPCTPKRAAGVWARTGGRAEVSGGRAGAGAGARDG